MPTSFTKAYITELHKRIEAALGNLVRPDNLVVTFKGGKYTDSHYNFKIEISVKNDKGEAQTKERDSFVNNGWKYGFHPSDLDRKVYLQATFSGAGVKSEFSIVGLVTRRSRYPVLCSNGSQRMYFTVQTILQALDDHYGVERLFGIPSGAARVRDTARSLQV